MSNLVGTGLNQVPTNGMLGGLAYQDPNHASIKDLDLKNLSQINSEIADTAVDVFVYDTRKDSDGGAWRKRTQNTSWYNETLGTATRGTRKEFPAVAVIVAESTKVTIYDGDDPDLPMWMVFNLLGAVGGNSNMLPRGGSGTESDITSIACLNGRLAVGLKDVSGSVGEGLAVIDFISELARIHRTTGSGYTGAIYNLSISGRNSNGLYSGDYNTLAIAAETINDVAMTVLPNAPVDSATGLPIPTIAVATDNVTSVIRDNASVVDYTGFNPIDKVAIDSSYVYAGTRSGSNDYIFKTTFLSSDANYNVNITAGSGGWYANSASNATESPTLKNMTVTDFAVTKDHTLIRSGNDGIEIFDGNVTTIDANEAELPIAYITSEYNTGYMPGDIKGAFLSDTDATDLDGGNKITNGDAWSGAQSSTSPTPPTGWTGGNGAQWLTSTGGDGSYIRLVNAGSAQGGPNSYMSQAITTVPGRKYKISVTQYHHATISVFLRAGTAETYSDLVQNSWTSSSGATPRYEQNTFTASGTTTYITLGIVSGTNTYSVGWDDVVVTEVDEDRSVNANGLHSFGTITKSAVATGAELVAYSGFSASNYLENTSFSVNFGNPPTISIMCWQKITDISDYSYFITFNAGSANRGGISNGSSSSGYPGQAYFNMGDDTIYSGFRVDDGEWHCIVGTINGTAKKLYVDGKQVSSTTISNHDMTGVDKIRVGTYGDSYAYPHLGSLALCRVSASVPSPAQVKKMYEDEKHLFVDNAKATLYGSSDAVTALAYDDTTELLHVGTSAGRSEFQGLRRINNTTTAVTTAISASNDLVAEQ